MQCVFTLGGSANSFLLRAAAMSSTPEGFYPFGYRLEVIGTLCWAVITGVWTSRLHALGSMEPKVRNGHMAALTVFCYLEL
jgi:hypothetical protein